MHLFIVSARCAWTATVPKVWWYSTGKKKHKHSHKPQTHKAIKEVKRKQTGQPTNTQEIINLTSQPGNQRTNQPNEQTTQSSNQARKHTQTQTEKDTITWGMQKQCCMPPKPLGAQFGSRPQSLALRLECATIRDMCKVWWPKQVPVHSDTRVFAGVPLPVHASSSAYLCACLWNASFYGALKHKSFLTCQQVRQRE